MESRNGRPWPRQWFKTGRFMICHLQTALTLGSGIARFGEDETFPHSLGGERTLAASLLDAAHPQLCPDLSALYLNTQADKERRAGLIDI